MTARKKVTTRKAKRTPSLMFHFDDGDMTLPVVEVERRSLMQYSAMAASDDPVLRLKGRQLLKAAAERAAKGGLASIYPSIGGAARGVKRKEKAADAQEHAVKQFRRLIATGELDANEAIAKMISEGSTRSTLYRRLAPELGRLGRGRKNVSRPKRTQKAPKK